MTSAPESERPCAIYYWARRDASDPAGGCVYFGISVNPEARWGQHLRDAARGSGYVLHRAIRKHGANAFVRRVEWLSSRAAAAEAEQAWIAEAKRRGITVYNLTAGGEGILDLAPESEQQRRKAVSVGGRRRFAKQTERTRRSETAAAAGAREHEKRMVAEAPLLARIAELHKQGLSHQKISDALGLPVGSVVRRVQWLKDAGQLPVEGRQRGAGRRLKARNAEAATLDRIAELHGQGFSGNQIAAALGLPRGNVQTRLRWLKEAGKINP